MWGELTDVTVSEMVNCFIDLKVRKGPGNISKREFLEHGLMDTVVLSSAR